MLNLNADVQQTEQTSLIELVCLTSHREVRGQVTPRLAVVEGLLPLPMGLLVKTLPLS